MPSPTADLPDLLARLDVALPPGEIVDVHGSPVLWRSAGQPPVALWARLRAAHSTTGLCPLLVAKYGLDPLHPPTTVPSPDERTADAVLAPMWDALLPAEDSEYLAEGMEFLRPFGRTWPGAHVRPHAVEDAGAAADAFAERLLDREAKLYLALVPAARAADVIAVLGWTGADSYRLGHGELTAVLRDWEDRFGARVVAFGAINSLDLSVAAPPQSESDALLVAAEHLAVCPDNIHQNLYPSLQAYAQQLIGARSWSFWWD